MRIDWPDKEVKNAVKAVLGRVSEEAAKGVVKDAQRILKRKARTTTESGLLSQFSIEKSKFRGGGFVVHCQGPRKWHEPYHASFTEFGAFVHPYGNKKRQKVYLEPIPFMRPAKVRWQRKVNRMFKDEFKKVL